MFKPFPVFIGWRHFSAGSQSRLVSFISLLAIIGLVLGVALLVVVLSIMNGFDQEMKTRILGSVPHLRLLQPQGVEQWQQDREVILKHHNVASVAPYAELEGMLNFRGEVQPVVMRGIVAGDHSFIAQFSRQNEVELADNELLLGRAVANKLQLSVNDQITLLIPRTNGNSGRQLAPLVRVFSVAGFIETKTTLDQTLAIANIATVNRLSGRGSHPQGLQVQVNDLFDVRNTGYQLLGVLPRGYSFSDWLQTHGNLYQAIKMSRSMVSLLVFLIVAIAVFNVISMLVMTVVDKRAGIAILKTLGASNGEVIKVFLTQGSLIGIAGSLLGAGLGVLLSLNVTAVVRWLEGVLELRFMNSEVYPIDYLPSQLVWSDVLMVVAVALLLNFLATIYPAWKAARMRPAEVLRYE